MEVIVVLVLILFGAFAAFAIWLTMATSLLESKAKKRAIADAPAILDAAFDGRADVTFEISGGSLPAPRVISGAAERGYRVRTQVASGKTGSTLIFEKVA